jgi:hypothetical protein
MGILPMFCGITTGGTPVRLKGKMPMLRFVRVLKRIRKLTESGNQIIVGLIFTCQKAFHTGLYQARVGARTKHSALMHNARDSRLLAENPALNDAFS